MEKINPPTTPGSPETSAHEELGKAAQMLDAIARHFATREPQDIVDTLHTHPEGRPDALHAIKVLHRYLLPPVSLPERDDAPLHEQVGERLLLLKPGQGRDGRPLKDYRVLDSKRFDLTGMEHRTYPFPVGDIFNNPDAAGPSSTFTIYPGLAAYFLKAIIIGEGSTEKRRLVDLLEDSQIIQLVGYTCAINKNRRYPTEKLSDLDIQAKRLLMQLGGISDQEIAKTEGSSSNDTSHIRKSRRVLLQHLHDYTDLLLAQMDEMLQDPDYQLFEPDPIKGLVFAPEAIASLETIIQPAERITPLKFIELAMRRYTANTLLARIENGETNFDDIVLNLKVIWLRVNGKNNDDIYARTRVSIEDQDKAFLALHIRQQRQLPLSSRPFWRQVHTLMSEAKTVLGENEVTISADAVSGLDITTEDMASAVPPNSIITKSIAIAISDKKFRERIEDIVSGGKLLDFMRWAASRPERWIQQMACHDDPDSVIVNRKNQRLPPDLRARCISCPVREICLGTALAEPLQPSSANYNYADYSRAERQEMLRTAGLDPNALQEMLNTEHLRGLE